MKTILSIKHIADKGKTETLREFAMLLLTTYPSYKPLIPIPATLCITKKDFRITIRNK